MATTFTKTVLKTTKEFISPEASNEYVFGVSFTESQLEALQFAGQVALWMAAVALLGFLFDYYRVSIFKFIVWCGSVIPAFIRVPIGYFFGGVGFIALTVLWTAMASYDWMANERERLKASAAEIASASVVTGGGSSAAAIQQKKTK